MEKIKHIKLGSDNKWFDWILKSDRNACESIDNSHMIRQLVLRHNQMADIINQLLDERQYNNAYTQTIRVNTDIDNLDSICIHDQCELCGGTGQKKDGSGACFHLIACQCPKCSPR